MNHINWSRQMYERSFSNPKEILYRLDLCPNDPQMWTVIYLHEQLEGDYHHKGKRFWFTVSAPVRCTIGHFGGSLEAAKKRALRQTIKSLYQAINGMKKVHRQAVSVVNQKEKL